MPEAQVGAESHAGAQTGPELGLEVGIERVLLGHSVVEVVYDCP
jgi:hypothetical protein